MIIEEAISQLTSLKEYIDKNIPLALADESLDMAIQALRTQQDGGWINADEKLPKTEGQLILIVLPNGEVHRCQWQGCTHELDPWYDEEENVWFADIVITHWQPLPEPPKGEKS